MSQTLKYLTHTFILKSGSEDGKQVKARDVEVFTNRTAHLRIQTDQGNAVYFFDPKLLETEEVVTALFGGYIDENNVIIQK